MELVVFYERGVIRIVKHELEAGYRASVPAPLPLRLLGRVIRLAPGLSNAAAEEWQHELAEVEGAIMAVVSAVAARKNRADAAEQLRTAADRYRAFLQDNASVVQTGIAGEAARLSRIELDRALNAAEDIANTPDPLDLDALEQTWQHLAHTMALLRGLRIRWLPLSAAPLAARVASRLWWKQFLPVRRLAYGRHLQRLESAEVASMRVGDQIGFRIRIGSPGTPGGAVAEFEQQLLDSPVEAFRSLAASRRRPS